MISKARESIGLGLACEQFGGSMFGSGARPSGILEHPGRLSDDARARLRGDFERLHSGIDNAHRVAVLEEGLKWTQTSIPPDDAQFLQTRAYQIEEIARWFNIPVSKLRVKDGGSYASLEQENSAFLTECLRPWLVRIEQEVRRKLLLPESSALYVEHNVDGLLRTDLASRYQAYSIGRNWGWLSVNEVRALEQDRSRAWRDTPRDQAHEGGLARAVGPDHRAHLALLDGKVHVAHRLEPAEAFRQPARFEQHRHGSHRNQR